MFFERMYACHLCCVICAVIVHVKMWRAAGVFVYTHRRLPGNSLSGKRRSIAELQKSPLFRGSPKIPTCSTSSHRVAPTELTSTNVLDSSKGFPCEFEGWPSILCGHRFLNILQVLQIEAFLWGGTGTSKVPSLPLVTE